MKVLTLESDEIRVQIAPEVGARIVSFTSRRSGYEYLWVNKDVPLRRELPGTEYDPNWYGGIDELLPNDPTERILGVECPDHGEYWTAEFESEMVGSSKAALTARLPLIGFEVSKTIEVLGNGCVTRSMITNHRSQPVPFLWKLHPALSIQPGDRIHCAAGTWSSANPEYSRRQGSGSWDGETVPELNGGTEFLYLHPLSRGYMAWIRGSKAFEVHFDPAVFRYAWYFASYGGFLGHQVAVLEPCTAMPMHVSEAVRLGQAAILNAGASIETTYEYRAIDED